MQVALGALRQGVLYDLLNREQPTTDLRQVTVGRMMDRFAVDQKQALRVERTALTLYRQLTPIEGMTVQRERIERKLRWAARLHEIGLVIAHSQHHQHGAYLLEHSDIAGFSATEQQFVAALVRNQRRGLHLKSIQGLPDRLADSALRCSMLLRLSVLLHRSHDTEPTPKLKLEIEDDLMLRLSGAWLREHPLTESDLDNEIAYLDEAGVKLGVLTD